MRLEDIARQGMKVFLGSPHRILLPYTVIVRCPAGEIQVKRSLLVCTVLLLLICVGSTAFGQCRKGGSCGTKTVSAAPPSQMGMRPSRPNIAAQVYLYNLAQAQQVAAQQAFTARQKMIREYKKQRGAEIAAAREAAKPDEEPKPKKAKPKTGVSGLLSRAAELETQR